MPEEIKEASFQESQGDKVRCSLCPHNCLIGEGGTGICKVRAVRGSRLVSLVYGRPIALSVDPIEKKPLFHFRPGARTFSYCTAGCNLACEFCQNHSISQVGAELRSARRVSAAGMVAQAESESCRVVAHTYTEPTVYFEYAYEIARLSSDKGLKNVFVTNGYTSREAIEQVAPYLHGANVDLKAFSDETYRRFCNGRLQPVLDTIKLMHALGIWVEVTTLVIPGMNDSAEELREIARFIASVSPTIPWHVSRFHPDYRLRDRGVTPSSCLRAAFDSGREEGLQFVYAGNLPGSSMEDTLCPGCAARLIERRGFRVVRNRLFDRACPECGTAIPGIWT